MPVTQKRLGLACPRPFLQLSFQAPAENDQLNEKRPQPHGYSPECAQVACRRGLGLGLELGWGWGCNWGWVGKDEAGGAYQVVCTLRPPPRQEAVPAWRAPRNLTVRVRKERRACTCGQAVHCRGEGLMIAIATHSWAKVIHNDEEYIMRSIRRRHRRSRCQCSQEE